MDPQDGVSESSWLALSDEQFLSKLQAFSKFKERSHNTYDKVHLPELNARLDMALDLPSASGLAQDDDLFVRRPDLGNTSKIEVVYLGNSMLERFQTTGRQTQLGKLDTAWNAGCGGDKNENVIYRLCQGMYDILKKAHTQSNPKCAIKVWVLALGTNNLHHKRGLRAADVASYKLLVESCLRIAPGSVVLACDVFYRKDVADGVVDASNEALKNVVEDMNRELKDVGEQGRVEWVDARGMMGKELLVDHVHLGEEGYTRWDEVLWPKVRGILRSGLEEERSDDV